MILGGWIFEKCFIGVNILAEGEVFSTMTPQFEFNAIIIKNMTRKRTKPRKVFDGFFLYSKDSMCKSSSYVACIPLDTLLY